MLESQDGLAIKAACELPQPPAPGPFDTGELRGITLAISNGPDVDYLCRALSEGFDPDNSKWLKGYRAAYFKVHFGLPDKSKRLSGFICVAVAITGLRWKTPGEKEILYIDGLVGDECMQSVSIEYRIKGNAHLRRTGFITF